MAMKNEKAKLNFLQWQGLYEQEKAYEIVTESRRGPDGRRTKLVLAQMMSKNLRDMWCREETLSLDPHGFAYRSTNSGFSNFERKRRILQEYLPRAASIYK